MIKNIQSYLYLAVIIFLFSGCTTENEQIICSPPPPNFTHVELLLTNNPHINLLSIPEETYVQGEPFFVAVENLTNDYVWISYDEGTSIILETQILESPIPAGFK